MSIKNVWFITEDQGAIGELAAGGRELGEQVTAVLFGEQNLAEEAIAFGADQVYLFKNPGETEMVEGYSKAISDLLRNEKANLVMVSASVSGKLLGGKIASQLGTSAIPNVSGLIVEDTSIIAKHMVFGGLAIRSEKALSEIPVVSVGAGVFKQNDKDTSRQGKIVEMNAEINHPGIKVIENRQKEGEMVNLKAAKKVIGVGRGFASEADLKMAEDLAASVGAELACSRPIAEGEKWMAKERYIGVSGVVLKPEVYVAIGISGQIQHMVGVNQAKTIIAINKDKNTPIFKQADIGLVGDIYSVLPKIVEKLKA